MIMDRKVNDIGLRTACGASSSEILRKMSLVVYGTALLCFVLLPAAVHIDAARDNSLDLDADTAEQCKLKTCFSRLSYCWFQKECACEPTDSLCLTKCAVCMNEAWFECCPCTGLCSLDTIPKQSKRKIIRLRGLGDVSLHTGPYSYKGKRHENGLLERLAAAVEMKPTSAPFNAVSFSSFAVSLRNNTKARPTRAATVTPPTEPASLTMSAHAGSTSSVTEEPTAVEMEELDMFSSGYPTLPPEPTTESPVTSELDIALLSTFNKYKGACDRNQCVTIYSTSPFTRTSCWKACDALGAKVWNYWSTGSCECRSSCCRRPTGHKKPLYIPESK